MNLVLLLWCLVFAAFLFHKAHCSASACGSGAGLSYDSVRSCSFFSHLNTCRFILDPFFIPRFSNSFFFYVSQSDLSTRTNHFFCVFTLFCSGHRHPKNQTQPQPLRHDRFLSSVRALPAQSITCAPIKRRCSIIIMACSFLMIHPGAILDLMLGAILNVLKKQAPTPFDLRSCTGRSDGKLEMDKLSYLSTMLLSVIALRFRFHAH